MDFKERNINGELERQLRYIMVDILGIHITESNKDTPRRIAKMLNEEVFCNRNNHNIEELNNKMTLFDNENKGSDNIIKVSDIEFSSMCEHHWMPFFGTVYVEYVPDEKIIGLSKIPRVVKYFSKKPQLQERLTEEIGKYLVQLLNPKRLEVIVVATHTCVKCRGIETDCETRTGFKFNREGIF